MTSNESELAAWDIQPGESAMWYNRFWTWLTAAKRSLVNVYNQEREKVNKSPRRSPPGAWREAFKRWEWEKRAAAWDAAERDRRAAEWEAKRQLLRDREWEAAEALLDRATQMLAFPLEITECEEKDVDGRVIHVTTINPVRWVVRDIPAMLEAASKLGRLATGMATNKIEVLDWRAEALEAGLDPDTVLDEVVKILIERLSASIVDQAGSGDQAAQAQLPNS